MKNNNTALVLHDRLQSLQGKTFSSEVALFDKLSELGITGLGDYRSGGRNRNIARKTALQYLEYQRADTTSGEKKKRAYLITKVFIHPKENRDGRGRNGKYIDRLAPLIVHTHSFSGSRAELFSSWNVYEPLISEQERHGNVSHNLAARYIVSQWRTTDRMKPGEEKYRATLHVKEKTSLEMALDSLMWQGILKWNEYYVYIPVFETGYEAELRRSLSQQELLDTYLTGVQRILEQSKKKNCVLKPELYERNISLSTDTSLYKMRSKDYYVNDKQPIIYEATPLQIEMYENYRKFIRQLTVYMCSGSKGEYCPEAEIPTEYEIFSDFKRSREYKKLDEQWRKPCLGWEKVWKEIKFQVISQERAQPYLEAYDPKLAFELGREYVSFMDRQMVKGTKSTQIYFSDENKEDFNGILSENAYGRLFPLNSSKSAQALHERLKKAYGV